MVTSNKPVRSYSGCNTGLCQVFWFCFVGLGGWCRGVLLVEELVCEVFGDLVSESGVSVVSVVDGFDELADFCSCLDGGEAVFVEEQVFLP